MVTTETCSHKRSCNCAKQVTHPGWLSAYIENEVKGSPDKYAIMFHAHKDGAGKQWAAARHDGTPAAMIRCV